MPCRKPRMCPSSKRRGRALSSLRAGPLLPPVAQSLRLVLPCPATLETWM